MVSDLDPAPECGLHDRVERVYVEFVVIRCSKNEEHVGWHLTETGEDPLHAEAEQLRVECRCLVEDFRRREREPVRRELVEHIDAVLVAREHGPADHTGLLHLVEEFVENRAWFKAIHAL
jgi:hypothetical protein